jgi:hypothetical protein
MNHKQMPRLGSAIASTILSVFGAVSLVGVDKAQAAVFTYNFHAEGVASGFFKVDDSSVTGIGEEYIAVSEGRLDTFLRLTYRDEEAKEYYNLAAEGATALFYQGVFRGLYAFGSDVARNKYFYFEDEPYGSYSFYYSGGASWSIDTRLRSDDEMWISYLTGYKDGYLSSNADGSGAILFERWFVYDSLVSYTLVNTEPSPVPEPLTAGGTALALAGLSWLKHKKKMAA